MWAGLTCLLYFACAVGLHALVARLHPRGNRVRQFAACGTVAGAAMLFHLWRARGGIGPGWLAGAVAFAFAVELYVFLFTFVTSSVSASLLVGATGRARAPGAAEPTTESMVRLRLLNLMAAGLLTEEADCYRLSRQGRILVAAYRGLRRLFRHEFMPEFVESARP